MEQFSAVPSSENVVITNIVIKVPTHFCPLIAGVQISSSHGG